MAVILTACAAPVAVKRLSPEDAHRALTASVLSDGRPSDFSEVVLRRHDLLRRYRSDPDKALARLYRYAAEDRPLAEELYAIAELSFAYAENGGGRPYYLAAAVYAAAVVFPEPAAPQLDIMDPRIRTACDIYNRALVEAFHDDETGRVVLEGGTYDLPDGKIEIEFGPDAKLVEGRYLDDFLPASDLIVKGLLNRYRDPGIGAPLVAKASPLDNEGALAKFTFKSGRIPATVFLRMEHPLREISDHLVHARLELYDTTQVNSISVGDRAYTLESESTVALAVTLEESRYWERELQVFLGRLLSTSGVTSSLVSRSGHRRGRIPVIFVHGTGSSPQRWADMVNDLESEKQIRDNFEAWFFSYDSGNPIAYSSYQLRKALTDVVDALDPTHTDRCLRDAVVIGHSQGGLLTKMTVVDAGDRFWRTVSDEPFEKVKMTSRTRELLRDALFVQPLPFVSRVVFIATPHRGSYLAGPQIIRRLAARFIQLPADVLRISTEVAGHAFGYESARSTLGLEQIPTSIDNMSPGNTFIQTLASIPVASGVTVNSIIAVKGDGPVETGDDGVVQYASAHIDGVESEFVVRSTHSTQANPHTVGEVRRILLEHAAAAHCGAPDVAYPKMAAGLP